MNNSLYFIFGIISLSHFVFVFSSFDGKNNTATVLYKTSETIKTIKASGILIPYKLRKLYYDLGQLKTEIESINTFSKSTKSTTKKIQKLMILHFFLI